MFRFTIRELVLLTLVVAMGVGWWVREQQMRAEIHRASRWRMAAGVLEDTLREDGWTVEWGYASGAVVMKKHPEQSEFKDSSYVHASKTIGFFEPSASEP